MDGTRSEAQESQAARSQTVRRRVVLWGLVVGPALLLLSSALIVPEASGGMRATFDAMAAQPGMLIAQSAVEAAGFCVSLAAFAAAAWRVQGRGWSLATTGALLCVIGVLGFTWSAAGGVFLSVLARMKDQDAGFAAAQALIADPVSGALISALMYAGEAGILLVLIGLLRGRLIPLWPIVIVIGGVIADLVLPGELSGLTADALLLATGLWTALALRRAAAPADAGTDVTSCPRRRPTARR